MDKTIQSIPEARLLLSSLRSVGYTEETAIADIIDNCISALENYDAVNVAVPAVDTIIEVEDNLIKSTPNRSSLMQVQTPQCFKLTLIKKAHELAKNDTNFTDDCGLITKNNLADVFVVQGDIENFKITYPKDFYLAEKILLERTKNNTLN